MRLREMKQEEKGENMDENRPCPIWNPSDVRVGSSGGGVSCWNSPRAGGEYFVDESALRVGDWLSDREKARLTTWLIKQRRLGTPRPVIPHDLQSVRSDHRKFKSIIHELDLTVHARADELLKYIQQNTPHIGRAFLASDFLPDMFAYTESVDTEELQYLTDYLVGKGWLEKSTKATIALIVTVEGYTRLAKLEQVIVDSSQAFVAMWFDNSLDPVYDEAISPAIKNMGYEAIRIDRRHHLDKIDDRIIAEIRRSRFIIADFTQGDGGARGGVYYEAGFAHGLDIPVIFTCRKDIVDRKLIHFDTRRYPHIVWNSPEELKMQLEDRIGAVIGDGPLKDRNSHV